MMQKFRRRLVGLVTAISQYGEYLQKVHQQANRQPNACDLQLIRSYKDSKVQAKGIEKGTAREIWYPTLGGLLPLQIFIGPQCSIILLSYYPIILLSYYPIILLSYYLIILLFYYPIILLSYYLIILYYTAYFLFGEG